MNYEIQANKRQVPDGFTFYIHTITLYNHNTLFPPPRPDLKLKTKIVTGKIKNNSDLSFQLINFSQGLFGILSIFRFCFQLLMSGLFPNYGGINSKAYFVKIKLTLES